MIRLTHILAGVLSCSLPFASAAKAEDEVEAPAGEVAPEEGAAREASTEGEGGQDSGAVGEGQGEQALGESATDQTATPPPEEESDTTEIKEKRWDSYSEKGGGVAEEITKGVRVEDIIEPPSDYRYAAFGKGDPFLPPLITEDARMANPLEIPIVSPLQRYKLADLKMVGIWQLPSGERKAMIMTPSDNDISQGIIVKSGDPIGQRGGRILGIGDDYLTVREFTLSPDGTRQYEDQQMFIGPRSFEDLSGKLQFDPGARDAKVMIEGAAGPGGVAPAAAPALPGPGGKKAEAGGPPLNKDGNPAAAKVNQAVPAAPAGGAGAGAGAAPAQPPPPVAAPAPAPAAAPPAPGGAQAQAVMGGGGAQLQGGVGAGAMGVGVVGQARGAGGGAGVIPK